MQRTTEEHTAFQEQRLEGIKDSNDTVFLELLEKQDKDGALSEDQVRAFVAEWNKGKDYPANAEQVIDMLLDEAVKDANKIEEEQRKEHVIEQAKNIATKAVSIIRSSGTNNATESVKRKWQQIENLVAENNTEIEALIEAVRPHAGSFADAMEEVYTA